MVTGRLLRACQKGPSGLQKLIGQATRSKHRIPGSSLLGSSEPDVLIPKLLTLLACAANCRKPPPPAISPHCPLLRKFNIVFTLFFVLFFLVTMFFFFVFFFFCYFFLSLHVFLIPIPPPTSLSTRSLVFTLKEKCFNKFCCLSL